ncbi:MAG: ABC transporter substrate-binding protein/permease [Planctomycetia bacterium]|nr:ABC transporter substrate-binding protein/permease [Planctomycetia bacterium]
MRRTGLLTIVFVALSTSILPAQEPDLDALRARLSDGVLRWGGDAEGGAPYQLRDPEDPARVIGFEVELADLLAEQLTKRLGKPIRAEFVQYEWVSLQLGLEKNDFDLLISGYEVSAERRNSVRFSRPYFIFAQQLTVRKDEEAIRTLDDCLRRPVGTLSGSAAAELLETAGARDVTGYDDNVGPYLDLDLGRVDAVLLDAPIAVYYASTNPRLKLVEPTFAPGEYAIGMRPSDETLAKGVDQALGELLQNGRWQQSLRKWRLWNNQQSALARGDRAEAEQTGLGFAPDGTPDAALQVLPKEFVNIDLVTSAADSWTFSKYAPLLVSAAGMTILLTVMSMTVAMLIGLLVCVMRLYGPWPARAAALGYVEFFRGVPLLLVLYFLYYGISGEDFQLPAIAAAVIGFGLNYAAYEAEIYRSAISAVPRGQWEAARALGMPETLTFRRIIFPQAIRTALGPMTNDLVALFKDTSLVSVIAVRELTKEYLILSRSSLKFVELGLLTAALYLAMSIPLGYLSRWLEARWGEK